LKALKGRIARQSRYRQPRRNKNLDEMIPEEQEKFKSDFRNHCWLRSNSSVDNVATPLIKLVREQLF
jgi:hypothetical protein